jgi:hypothetical protein
METKTVPHLWTKSERESIVEPESKLLFKDFNAIFPVNKPHKYEDVTFTNLREGFLRFVGFGNPILVCQSEGKETRFEAISMDRYPVHGPHVSGLGLTRVAGSHSPVEVLHILSLLQKLSD